MINVQSKLLTAQTHANNSNFRSTHAGLLPLSFNKCINCVRIKENRIECHVKAWIITCFSFDTILYSHVHLKTSEFRECVGTCCHNSTWSS